MVYINMSKLGGEGWLVLLQKIAHLSVVAEYFGIPMDVRLNAIERD